MFRRKFGYESEDYPKFSDLVREDDLDAEVHCTGYGFTKEMEKDILQEYGMIDEDDEDVEEANNASDVESNITERQLVQYRHQLENEVSFSESKAKKTDDSIRRYIESCTQYLGSTTLDEVSTTLPAEDDFVDAEGEPQLIPIQVAHPKVEAKQFPDDDASMSSNDLETDALPELANVDPDSRMYRLKMVEKLLSDARSQRSYSTTASTIAPSVITDRIKKNMDVKEKREMRKKCVAKGEANATHRHRKENKDVVKEYAGWDF